MVDMTEQDYRRRLYVQSEKIYTEQMGINRLDRLQTPEQKDYIRRITKQSELKKPYQEDDYQGMEYHLDISKGITIPRPSETTIEVEVPSVAPINVPSIPENYYSIIITSDVSWATAYGATTGDTLYLSSANRSVSAYDYYSTEWEIERIFLSFDLLEQPSTKTIQSVSLITYGNNDTDFPSKVSVQKGTQDTPLTINNFSAYTGTYFSNIYRATGYTTHSFNAAGIAYVQTNLGLGDVKFCIREGQYDYNNTTPPEGDASLYTYVAGPTNATVANRPVLRITYTF